MSILVCVCLCVRVLLENCLCRGQGAEGHLGYLRKWTYETRPKQVEGMIAQPSLVPGLCQAVWLLAW